MDLEGIGQRSSIVREEAREVEESRCRISRENLLFTLRLMSFSWGSRSSIALFMSLRMPSIAARSHYRVFLFLPLA